MNWTAIVLFVIAANVAFAYGSFLRNPEYYGDIMRRFDEARFHYVDCDCTVSME